MNECKMPRLAENKHPETISLSDKVRNMASQCVKCGLCLPHCPTYILTEDENESPRGRIELLKAVAEEVLSPTPKVQKHLDHCLACRACEKVCPAKVQYGNLITHGRAMILQHPDTHKTSSILHRLFNTLASHPKQLTLLHKILWLLEKSYLRPIATHLKIPQLLGLNKLNQFLPKVDKPTSLKSFYSALSEKKGSVGLFLGCFQQLADVEIHKASIKILTHLGYDVYIPKTQTCCGAISLHEGKTGAAQSLIQQNVSAFEMPFSVELDYIVSSATGCGTVLHGYPNYLNSDIAQDSRYHSFANKIVDISTLILNSTWPANLKLKNFEKKIAVHSPCTLRNVWQTPEHAIQLLQRIPNAKIHPIKTPYCCGAAGTYMFDFPEIAHDLMGAILDELTMLQADVIVTSNIGCALHLKQSLKQKKFHIDVMHPITLLSNLIFF